MTIYDIFFAVFSIIYLPYLIIKGKAHRDFPQRFGVLPPAFTEIGRSRPVWVHAVSVGEVIAAGNFVKEFSAKHPARKIVFSTTTKTGNAMAHKLLGGDIAKFYFPLDFSFAVKKTIKTLNPSLFVAMETEIWPNLILELSKAGTPVCIINGRLSERSFAGYRRVGFFFKPILKKISAFCMQADSDRRRIEDLGAPARKVKVTGNMKFDVRNTDDHGWQRQENQAISQMISDNLKGQLLIAGSTHPGEEDIVLGAYEELLKKFPDLKLLIAPRHVDRAGDVRKLAEKKRFKAILLSEVKKTQGERVFILDTMGELGSLYRFATVVFLGGSLVKRGGHNIVEPAIFGKPILFGPHMFNFSKMAREFLKAGAAWQVEGGQGLRKALESLLAEGRRRELLGQAAREIIENNKGALEANIKEVEALL